jgi:Domain of unknown function (DUF5668)/Cell wall-active antibiotics response 4TMS YvqF
MSTDTRLHHAPHLALGIILVAIGVALTLDTLHVMDAERIFRFWPVGLILLGAGVIAQSFWPSSDLPPDGRRRRGSAVPFFVLVWVVVALAVGPRMAMGRRGAPRSDGRERVSMFAVMGADERSSVATTFRGGEITSVMGGSKLDLRQATLAPGEEAVIDVFAMMGGIELRVPDGWVVDVQSVSVMGGVKDERPGVTRRRFRSGPAEAGGADARSPESNAPEAKAPVGDPAVAPRLVVRGFIMMGGLIIKS